MSGGNGQGKGVDKNSPSTQEADADNGEAKEGSNNPGYITRESAASCRKPDTRAVDESGGRGYREQTRTPAADTAGVTGASPEHHVSSEYGLLTLNALAGYQDEGAIVVRGDGTTVSPVEI